MPSLQEGPVPSTSERTPMTPTNTCDYLNRNGLSQNGYGRGGLVEQDILNFFILDVGIFNLKNLYASVRQNAQKLPKKRFKHLGILEQTTTKTTYTTLTTKTQNKQKHVKF